MSTIKERLKTAEAVIERAVHVTNYGLLGGVPIILFLWSPAIGIIAGVCVAFKFSEPITKSRDTHGSSRWATLPDLMQARCVFQNGLFLGRLRSPKSLGRWFDLRALLSWPLSMSRQAVVLASLAGRRPEQVDLVLPDKIPHCAIYGASGSGKSTSYCIPHALSVPGSIVVLDAKGEICKLTAAERARRFGSEIVVIDPFGVAKDCGFPAAKFNPLDLMRQNPERLVDEARRLAGALVVETGEEKEPFWNNASKTLLTTVMTFLVSEGKQEFATLNHVREMMTNPDMMNEMLEHIGQSDACGGLLRRLGGQLRQLEGKTKASVYSVGNSHIDFLDSLALADTLSSSTFDANRLVNGNVSVYLCLPVDRVNELSGLQRVLLTSLINVVFAAGEDRHRRVHFLLDEAATLGSMDSLYNAVQFGRSFGHRMSFYFQSVSQLERCFPESQAQDFRATTAEVFCGVANFETAKEVSEWIGQTTVVSSSGQDGSSWGTSVTNGTFGAGQSVGHNWGGSHSRSYNETGRALIMPEEVLQMPQNEAIVLIPGVRPVRTEKVPYFAKSPTKNGLKRFQASMRGLFYVGAAWVGMAASILGLLNGYQ